MGLWGDWQASRERRHRVGLYLNHVLREPDAGALAWLTTLKYTSALAVRGSAEPPAARLARVMLTGAGVRQPTTEQHGTATQCVLNMRAALNEQLRAAIGAASLPDDVRPSALRG